jgi:hypothetical protein
MGAIIYQDTGKTPISLSVKDGQMATECIFFFEFIKLNMNLSLSDLNLLVAVVPLISVL